MDLIFELDKTSERLADYEPRSRPPSELDGAVGVIGTGLAARYEGYRALPVFCLAPQRLGSTSE